MIEVRQRFDVTIQRESATAVEFRDDIVSSSATDALPYLFEDYAGSIFNNKPIYTLEQAALRLEFPSGTALRNMLMRYTGLKPRELRENGGVHCVMHLFRRELGGARTSAGLRPPASA